MTEHSETELTATIERLTATIERMTATATEKILASVFDAVSAALPTLCENIGERIIKEAGERLKKAGEEVEPLE